MDLKNGGKCNYRKCKTSIVGLRTNNSVESFHAIFDDQYNFPAEVLSCLADDQKLNRKEKICRDEKKQSIYLIAAQYWNLCAPSVTVELNQNDNTGNSADEYELNDDDNSAHHRCKKNVAGK